MNTKKLEEKSKALAIKIQKAIDTKNLKKMARLIDKANIVFEKLAVCYAKEEHHA